MSKTMGNNGQCELRGLAPCSRSPTSLITFGELFVYCCIRDLEQQLRTMSDPGSPIPKILVLHGYVAYLVIRRLA
jgi:hypothetical protein